MPTVERLELLQAKLTSVKAHDVLEYMAEPFGTREDNEEYNVEDEFKDHEFADLDALHDYVAGLREEGMTVMCAVTAAWFVKDPVQQESIALVTIMGAFVCGYHSKCWMKTLFNCRECGDGRQDMCIYHHQCCVAGCWECIHGNGCETRARFGEHFGDYDCSDEPLDEDEDDFDYEEEAEEAEDGSPDAKKPKLE
jgi:hypothetical protein